MFVEGGAKTEAGPFEAEAKLETAPTEWIEREIGELAAHIAAATCRWLELIAELDRRGGHEAWGFHSSGAWVAWRCSIDPRSARASIRRAIDARDGGHCQFPGCENRRWVDAHHIVHWARGGQTKIDNLVLLCSRHHRLVHEGGFGVARTANGGLVFRQPDGKPVPAVPSPTRGSCAELRGHNRRVKLRIDPNSAMSLGRGEPFDRELAVSGLLARAGP